MKKVEKISIADISFTLDNDAYLSLKKYFDSLHNYYAQDPDGREIIADIEARIAELILEHQIYTKVVSKGLIDSIVAQLGNPEEIDDESGESTDEAGFSGTGMNASSDPSIPRRLYRDREGKIFGGVCSGIAKFMNISVAWVRLVFLLPLIITVIAAPIHWWWGIGEFGEGWSWVFFMTYIVLWVALPMARTPRQKLEARGERITPSSIRQNLQGAATTPAGKKAASVAAELLTVVGRVVLFFVKFLTTVIGFSFMMASVGILVGMIAALVSPDALMVNSYTGMEIFSVLDGMRMISPLLFVELVLLCTLLPLFVIGVTLLGFTFNWRLGRVFYGVVLGVWAVAVLFLGIVSTTNARFFHEVLPERVERWDDRWDDMEDRWEERERRGVYYRRDVENVRESGGGGVENASDVDPNRDSLMIVVRKDGTRDTITVSSESQAPASSSIAADEVSSDQNGSKRIEIRRVE